MTDHRREHLQALADQARGHLHAAEDATRRAVGCYVVGHAAGGAAFVADARREMAAAGELLDRLARLGEEGQEGC